MYAWLFAFFISFFSLTDPCAAAINVVNEGWDGRVLICEEMPEDAPKGPAFWDFDKTAADVEYVVSRKLSNSMVSSIPDIPAA